MSEQGRLRFRFGKHVRSGRFFVPPEWPLWVSQGPMRLIVVLGGDISDVMIQRTLSFRDGSHPFAENAIIVYPDPLVATDFNGKFWGGFTGPLDSDFLEPDEPAFVAELLRRVRVAVQGRVDERNVALSRVQLHDAVSTDLYLVGYSAGAILANQIAARFNPLTDADGVSYTVKGLAVYAMTTGGYRRGDEIGIPALENLNFPDTSAPPPPLDVLIVHGADDDQVANRTPGLLGVDTLSDPHNVLAGNNLVVGQDAFDRFAFSADSSLAYPDAEARLLARWDYTVRKSGRRGTIAGST